MYDGIVCLYLLIFIFSLVWGIIGMQWANDCELFEKNKNNKTASYG